MLRKENRLQPFRRHQDFEFEFIGGQFTFARGCVRLWCTALCRSLNLNWNEIDLLKTQNAVVVFPLKSFSVFLASLLSRITGIAYTLNGHKIAIVMNARMQKKHSKLKFLFENYGELTRWRIGKKKKSGFRKMGGSCISIPISFSLGPFCRSEMHGKIFHFLDRMWWDSVDSYLKISVEPTRCSRAVKCRQSLNAARWERAQVDYASQLMQLKHFIRFYHLP